MDSAPQVSTPLRWAPLPGHPRWEISTHGGVRRDGGFCPTYLTEWGYPYFRIHTQKNNTTLHSAVLATFVGPRPEGAVIRHLDGNPTNNDLANLAYGTPSENNYDIVRHGKHRNARKTHCARGHAYDEDNTYRTSKGRYCRPCNRINVANYKARKVAAA